MPPLFSIIAPTMGRLELWQHALRSAANQTFDDFEIVAVNSRHTPQSGELIASLGNTKVRYLTPDQKQGHLNWDIGYRAARGKYILWLDDDNYLLPDALRTLADIIAKHQPDLATGDHVHWYEPNFPEKNLRNMVRIPIPRFSGVQKSIRADYYLARLFGTTTTYAPERARFHFTETAVRREFLQQILAKTGPIDFTDASPRFLQLALLANAKTIWYTDTPIAIVIQMGDSMAYRWLKKEARKTRFAVRHRCSPVSADTYNNYTLDNMLRAKNLFPEAFSRYEVAWPLFFTTYARELVLLDQSSTDRWRSWNELRSAAHTHGVSVRLWPLILGSELAALLKLLRIYPLIRALSKKQGGSNKPATHAYLNSEVHTIADAASALPTILAN